MTGIEINELQKANCLPTPARKDLLIVDECPNCKATMGAIRRIKENTKAVKIKCGNCASTLHLSTLNNEIKVLVKGRTWKKH